MLYELIKFLHHNGIYEHTIYIIYIIYNIYREIEYEYMNSFKRLYTNQSTNSFKRLHIYFGWNSFKRLHTAKEEDGRAWAYASARVRLFSGSGHMQDIEGIFLY
jgi:predicted P-loop ATPase/GTPase